MTCECDGKGNVQRLSGTFPSLIPEPSTRTRYNLAYSLVVMRSSADNDLDDV